MKETTLAQLADRFDYFLLDQFGVLLDGTAAYPGAAQAMKALAARRKQIIVLTNSGKRAGPNEARLVRMGFDRSDFSCAVSSGEAAFGFLSAEIGRTIAPGAPVFVLARDDDQSCIEGLDLTRTEVPDRAELVLIAGSRGDEIPLEDYAAMLSGPAGRGTMCYCTNPDMTMLTPGGTAFGPGRIAALFRELGGEVAYVGKPYPLIYQAAIDAFGNPEPGQVVCIGDSPEHDVRGAHSVGCAAALVRTGIHADTPLDQVLAGTPTSDVPDFVIPRFAY